MREAARSRAGSAHPAGRVPSRQLHLPPVARGWHRTPAHGGCLMELTALVAGELWTDRPTCVDPVLAAIARRVNDESSAAARHRLVPMIPLFIGTVDGGPMAAAHLVVVCADTVLALDDAHRSLTSRQRRSALAAARTARYLLRRRHPDTAGQRGVRMPQDGSRPDRRTRWLVACGDTLGLTDTAYRWLIAPSIAGRLTGLAARGARCDRDTVLTNLLRCCVAAVLTAVENVPDSLLGPTPAPIIDHRGPELAKHVERLKPVSPPDRSRRAPAGVASRRADPGGACLNEILVPTTDQESPCVMR